MTDIKKLCEELRAGVSVSGETSTGVELYDIDGAETVMHRAADALTALERRIAELEAALKEIRRKDQSGPLEYETKSDGQCYLMRRGMGEVGMIADAALRALGGEHG